MMTKQAMVIEKVKENGVEQKTSAQKCMEEMQPILDKYNCQIICIPQNMYGQKVYVPMIEEIKKP